MADPIIVRGEGITLDLLLWRVYGVRGRSLLEAALELNPGIADLGNLLPLGTRVAFPDLPAVSTIPVQSVSLFG